MYLQEGVISVWHLEGSSTSVPPELDDHAAECMTMQVLDVVVDGEGDYQIRCQPAPSAMYPGEVGASRSSGPLERSGGLLLLWGDARSKKILQVRRPTPRGLHPRAGDGGRWPLLLRLLRHQGVSPQAVPGATVQERRWGGTLLPPPRPCWTARLPRFTAVAPRGCSLRPYGSHRWSTRNNRNSRSRGR